MSRVSFTPSTPYNDSYTLVPIEAIVSLSDTAPTDEKIKDVLKRELEGKRSDKERLTKKPRLLPHAQQTSPNPVSSSSACLKAKSRSVPSNNKSFLESLSLFLEKKHFDNLCLEAFDRAADSHSCKEQKELLCKVQQQKVWHCLQNRSLLEAFNAKSHHNINSFAAIEGWLENLNLIHMCYRLTGKHYSFERTTAANALESVANGVFNVTSYAKTLANSFEADSRWKFDLSNAALTDLPRFITWFVELSELKLAGNQLRAPQHLESIPKLEKLNLRDNFIHPNWQLSLPEGTKNKSIKVLDLRKNGLHHLPEVIFQLENLNTLSLAKNAIRRLPVSITKLGSLRLLDLDSVVMR